jgi:hypothetical protein
MTGRLELSDKLRQIAIDAQIHMVSEERLAEFAHSIIKECMYICEDVALEFSGVARGELVTDQGKTIHTAMGMGARNCAVYIHNEWFGDREVCDCDDHKE